LPGRSHPEMTPSPSDHFNGKTFFWPGGRSERGFLDLIRWKFTSRTTPWPIEVPLPARTLPPAPEAAKPGLAVTWIGQSTFLLRAGGQTFLTDPIYSRRASPFAWIGPERVLAPAIPWEALPRIDWVLLSHDHFDHCDLPTLRQLARRDHPGIVSPLGYRTLLGPLGFRERIELDWWDERTLPNTGGAPAGAKITWVPSRHWCRRRPGATNVRLWGGCVLEAGGRRIYFVGDSGYDDRLFKDIGRRAGPPDLALIPIGAYEPRWFMREAHMNPAEAVRVHLEVGARRSLGMHWGTFQLTDEGRDAPVTALEAATKAAGLQKEAFEAADPGYTLQI